MYIHTYSLCLFTCWVNHHFLPKPSWPSSEPSQRQAAPAGSAGPMVAGTTPGDGSTAPKIMVTSWDFHGDFNG